MNRIRTSCASVSLVVSVVFSAHAGAPMLLSPAADATVATLNATQKAYYAKTLDERRSIDAQTDAPPKGVRKTLVESGTSFPLKTTFMWSGTGPFQLVIRRAADRSVFFVTNGLTATSWSVGNFEIGCGYVWSVANADGASSVHAFTTEAEGPRLLDGASELCRTNVWGAGKAWEYRFSNPTPHGVRDIGGIAGLDGRRVRQGMIIRSSQLDSEYSATGTTSYITDRNRAFWKDFLGIRTEIDLRSSSESKLTASPLGSDVTYRHFASMTAYAEYLQGNAVKNNVRDIVKLFADEANYPIDFHCVHGKDRTGAVALILEGLLGVSEEDIARDYQATMFWNPLQASERFFALEDYFRTNRYANASNVSLNEGICNYVKKVGVTADEIDAFREIMLEPAAKRWTGKTVAVVGDSYSAWAGAAGVTNAYYPSSECGVTQESQMWWSQVIAHYDGTPGVVAAGSGSRISEDCVSGGVPMGSFANRVKDGELGDPDVILVLGGLNDWWHEIPTADFYAACGSLFDTLDARYPRAEKIVLLSKLPDVWGVGIPDDYRRALRTAALTHGCAVVDLEGAYNVSGNVKEGHPTALGMTNIAQRIVATLEGTYVAPELPPYVPPAGPETYDYLDSDGSGYLLTDYPLDILKTHVELKFQLLEDQPEGNQSLFWVDNTTTGEEWGCTQWDKGGGIGYYYNASSGAVVVDGLPDFQETHVIRVGGNTARFDGNPPTSGEETAVAIAKANILLFASRHYASPYAVQYKARYRLYSFKIWEDDETQPVRHYVPAKNPDGAATLYDIVTGTYLDPSTGSFSVGNIEKIDVPTVHTEPFSYDSTLKRPITAGDTYTVGGDTAASVPGDYVVTVTPKGGYTWQDGTRTPKPFAWSIVGDFAKEARDGGWETRATIGGRQYCILAYTNSAAWTVPEGVTNVEFLVVAGGGAGGASGATKDYRSGGGGGAGGVVTGRVDVAAGSTLTLTVGAGGAAVSTAGQQGANGGDSGIANGSVNVVTVKGGGAGGSATSTGVAGCTGGSGGGGSSKNSSTGTTNGGSEAAPIVATGVIYEAFGNNGGKGYGKSCAGGGGGAGGVGASAASGVQGVGGAGLALCLSGEEIVYAAGGNGGVENEVADVVEATGSGNGGNGAYRTSSTRYKPTSGGSGIVVIRYEVPPDPLARIAAQVAAAKSGVSVLPDGVSADEVVLAADGASFAIGGRAFAKPHYVFSWQSGGLVAAIRQDEAEIRGFEQDEENGLFTLGTVETVEGFRYSLKYADDLSVQPSLRTVGSSVSGNGEPLKLTAPISTGSCRFYRLVVTDACP